MTSRFGTRKTAIILSAGLGTRMKSQVPKVLHKVAGKSMISLVAAQLEKSGVDEIRVVIGHGGDQVKKELQGHQFYTQKNQLGTADAVKSADVDSLEGLVLICNGDHPLITSDDYKWAFESFGDADLMVVSCKVKNPKEFGRIVRNSSGEFLEIVEAKDASKEEKNIKEVNTGLYVVKAEVLKKFLPEIKNNNSKKEYYLTDLVALAINAGHKVMAKPAKFKRVIFGVNNQVELSQAGKILYLRKAKELMMEGVIMIDPSNTYIEMACTVGAGTTIEPHCMIKGRSQIAENVHIKLGTLIEDSVVGKGCILGPYARLRPESVLGEEVHIGNFVELKKTIMGDRAKANHLTYLGDAEIGEGTNIGCGTITCNYAVDRKKYKTIIGKNVFVGSDSQFIAPVTVGDGAVIGSGSTITKDVPANALGVARAKQFIKENYNKDN